MTEFAKDSGLYISVGGVDFGTSQIYASGGDRPITKEEAVKTINDALASAREEWEKEKAKLKLEIEGLKDANEALIQEKREAVADGLEKAYSLIDGPCNCKYDDHKHAPYCIRFGAERVHALAAQVRRGG